MKPTQSAHGSPATSRESQAIRPQFVPYSTNYPHQDGKIDASQSLTDTRTMPKAQAGCAFLTSYHSPDGQRAALLELRSQLPQALENPQVRELAQEICRMIAERTPRFLNLDSVSQAEKERVALQCRLQALENPAPDKDMDTQVTEMYRSYFRQPGRCLDEQVLSSPPQAESVSSRLKRISAELQLGPVWISRFYSATAQD